MSAKPLPSWCSNLRNPPAAFRPMPFWAWNSRLDARELVRQVGELARGGMGGFFMHVRYGLETEYLSPEFMSCIRAVVGAARKRGMEAWLYDEDRWPSGFGGGKVTSHADYRIKALQWDAIPAASFGAPPADAIRCFCARIESGDAFDVRPLKSGERPRPGSTVLVYRVVSSTGIGWFNHTNYLDAMNPEAVAEFIRVTHEAYKREIGKEFGRTVPGIFTDEPNIGSFHRGADTARCYPWTTRLPAEFRKRIGYDLLDRLVEISHRLEGRAVSNVRRDYRRVTTELYTEAYSRQIGEWCARNRLELTGHELAEESLGGQTDQVGACMPHYEWFQRPGIDILRDTAPEVLTAKQCVSVASQMGRKRVLSELYGCTGWDATFEMYKHIGDWHQALGVNHFCPHLSWYSMAGGAKRDYPACIFYQSPWWREFPMLGDYFGRLSLALTQGEPVREIVVIHPIESAWLVHNREARWRTDGYSKSLETLCNSLLDNQMDFDFADESMLPRHGSVAQADGGARLLVGRMSYRIAIVPESLTLRSTTLDLLERFARLGGRVIFCGERPLLEDGGPSERPARLAARCESLPSAALPQVLGADGRRVEIAPANRQLNAPGMKIWSHLRESRKEQILFLCNRSRSEGGALTVRWTGAGRIREVDLLTGSLADVGGIEHAGGSQSFALAMPPAGSALFVRTPEPQAPVRRASRARSETARMPLAGEWSFALDEPNAINLDRARMRVGGADAPWRPPRLLWRQEAELRAELGFPNNAVPAEQPYIWMKQLSSKSAVAELEFDVEVETPPRSPVSLALEHPERFEVEVNGRKVAVKERGWFVDRAIRVVPLAGCRLRKGSNKLRLKSEYRQRHWLEEVYLTGAFGSRAEGNRMVIGALPQKLAIGDWVPQGLAMYSGAVTYSQRIRIGALPRGSRVVLCLDRVKATLARVAVNGRKLGRLAWAPWEIDITRAVRSGALNSIEVTLFSSRRNLLGPLHHRLKHPAWTGPMEFRTEGQNHSDAYNLVPYGLLGECFLSVQKRIP